MKALSRKQISILWLALAIVIAGVFAGLASRKEEKPLEPQDKEPAMEKETQGEHKEIIGYSVEGRKIEAYTYGEGNTHLLFVGGIHGGYEWNTVVLAYRFIDYLRRNPEGIPENIKVSVIPSANPDGVYEAVGKESRFTALDVPEGDFTSSRFNARDVDLNRNFGCNWKSESTWKGRPVKTGTKAFSEPEVAAIRDFVLENDPRAVIFWHSKADAVYASQCEDGILPETIDIMNEYSRAAGYRPEESFDAYEISGDSEGWLASIGIPAITVELETHNRVEWESNLSGIKVLFEYYKEEE